jgi:hypothetical protein
MIALLYFLQSAGKRASLGGGPLACGGDRLAAETTALPLEVDELLEHGIGYGMMREFAWKPRWVVIIR